MTSPVDVLMHDFKIHKMSNINRIDVDEKEQFEENEKVGLVENAEKENVEKKTKKISTYGSFLCLFFGIFLFGVFLFGIFHQTPKKYIEKVIVGFFIQSSNCKK
jgi:hypothetical protein